MEFVPEIKHFYSTWNLLDNNITIWTVFSTYCTFQSICAFQLSKKIYGFKDQTDFF